MFSPLLDYTRKQVKKAALVFTIDKTARFWQTLPDELKCFALRAAQLDETPQHWGAYSPVEKRRIQNTFLTFHELDRLRLVMEKEAQKLEKRVNAPDEEAKCLN